MSNQEWLNESDEGVVPGPYKGLIVRNPGIGHLCGYVGVPQGHPWFGESDYDVDATVHGGLTFAGSLDEDGLWYVGFDCAHSGDLCPGMDAPAAESHWNVVAALTGETSLAVGGGKTYRNWAYVKAEVESLMAQAEKAVAAVLPMAWAADA